MLSKQKHTEIYNMSHWQFLIEKLGKDVVRYCIQPFIIPCLSVVMNHHNAVMAQVRRCKRKAISIHILHIKGYRYALAKYPCTLSLLEKTHWNAADVEVLQSIRSVIARMMGNNLGKFYEYNGVD